MRHLFSNYFLAILTSITGLFCVMCFVELFVKETSPVALVIVSVIEGFV